MVRSMTGFASTTISLAFDQTQKVNIAITLKSLNSRFFDSTCKLPYPLSNLETDFIKLFKNTLGRGYIHFAIHVSNPAIFKSTVEPLLPLVKEYLDAVDQIKTAFTIKENLSIKDIISLPNIFVTYEQDLDEQVKSIIIQTTQNLIDELITMQLQEGVALRKDIENRMQIIANEIAVIEKLFLKSMDAQKTKITASLQELGADESKLADTAKTALYTILDKMDINEEIVRFKSHIASIEKELQSRSDEKGKRLDFIFQELNREINTIMAKSSESTMSAHAITIKVELEKAREQAQNIV